MMLNISHLANPLSAPCLSSQFMEFPEDSGRRCAAFKRMITFIKLINMLVYFTLNRESLHQQEVVVIQTGKYVDTQIQFLEFLRTATKLFLRAQMDEPCKRMHAKIFGKNLNVFVPITNSLYQYYCYLKNIVLLLTILRGGSKIT